MKRREAKQPSEAAAKTDLQIRAAAFASSPEFLQILRDQQKAYEKRKIIEAQNARKFRRFIHDINIELGEY
jgi:hypothetical protein